jgi:hypothetical protein
MLHLSSRDPYGAVDSFLKELRFVVLRKGCGALHDGLPGSARGGFVDGLAGEYGLSRI